MRKKKKGGGGKFEKRTVNYSKERQTEIEKIVY